MSGSWSARDRLEARVAACVGEFRPLTYNVRIDDEHAQWKYRIAARGLGMEKMASFFAWAAEYVIAHHRELKEVRRTIRQAERQIARDKKERQRREAAGQRKLEELARSARAPDLAGAARDP